MTYDRDKYARRKKVLHALGLTANGKARRPRSALTFEHRLALAAPRFWSNAQKGNGCWTWTAGHSGHGYGKTKIAGRTIGAHRVAWMLTYGPIPGDLFVCHSCDNRECVNPSHLWLGTPADNMTDKVSKGRQARGPEHGAISRAKNPAHGTRMPQSKITDDDARAIRAMRAEGATLAAIARRFGICAQSALNVSSRKTWKHVA